MRTEKEKLVEIQIVNLKLIYHSTFFHHLSISCQISERAIYQVPRILSIVFSIFFYQLF
jgi:hypothetical protein